LRTSTPSTRGSPRPRPAPATSPQSRFLPCQSPEAPSQPPEDGWQGDNREASLPTRPLATPAGWIIRNQFGRRNLSSYDRAVLALKLEPVLKEKAKANLSAGGGDRKSPRQKSGKAVFVVVNTSKEVAAAAKVSHDTIAKVKVIEARMRKNRSGWPQAGAGRVFLWWMAGKSSGHLATPAQKAITRCLVARGTAGKVRTILGTVAAGCDCASHVSSAGKLSGFA
jgi:hypothetical protein